MTPPRAPAPRGGFTFVEVIVAASLLAVAVALFTQMIQGGSTGVSSAIWRRDRLAESQRFLSALERDLKAAGNAVRIDMTNATSDAQVAVNVTPFIYEAGSGSEPVDDPGTGESKPMPVVKAAEPGAGGPGEKRPLFKWLIQRPEVVSGPERQAGYRIEAAVWLEGGELRYEKKLVAGDLTGTGEEAHPPRTVLRDVAYVHVSHTDIVSRFTGRPEGALVYLFIRCRNPQPARGGDLSFTARQSFRLNTRAVCGGGGGS